MAELITFNFLNEHMDVPAFMEKPDDKPKRFLLIERTGGGETEHLPSATLAIQSYAESLYQAAELNKRLKEVIKGMENLQDVRGLSLNSDYNFTDTRTKEYRYQAVFDIKYY